MYSRFRCLQQLSKCKKFIKTPLESSPFVSTCRRLEIHTNIHNVKWTICQPERKLVLGIETSCDDTGAAIVNSDGIVLGDALSSQLETHLKTGGIIPAEAQKLHKQNIERVVKECLKHADVKLEDLDAIAVTTRPGLALCLSVGLSYAKELVSKSKKPMIPIHHMQAHALTARMIHKLEFPFLVLLISGGHSMIVLAKGIEDFVYLGGTVDKAVGDSLDKVARELKLKDYPGCEKLSGGAAIEKLASLGDVSAIEFPSLTKGPRDCNFSVSGIDSYTRNLIQNIKKEEGVSEATGFVSQTVDICAGYQYTLVKLLARKLQRALLFCEIENLLPEKKILVLSGGVASNFAFRTGLAAVCRSYDCTVICPPPSLCTDNGIMIAWNGMEKLLAGKGISMNPAAETYQDRCPIGEDWSHRVSEAGLKLPSLNATEKLLKTSLQKQKI